MLPMHFQVGPLHGLFQLFPIETRQGIDAPAAILQTFVSSWELFLNKGLYVLIDKALTLLSKPKTDILISYSRNYRKAFFHRFFLRESFELLYDQKC